MKQLVQDYLMTDLKREIIEDMVQRAESFVILRSQERYRKLLMTGPFQCEDLTNRQSKEERPSGPSRGGRRNEEELIPDRPRTTVMGVILQQIDNQNSIVTLAVVDKYGELVAHKDLKHMMKPRELKKKQNLNPTEEEAQRQKKVEL